MFFVLLCRTKEDFMKTRLTTLAALLLFIAGCAWGRSAKPTVWEAENIPKNYDVLGPVSVTEQKAEKTEDMIQGLAGFISKDGRISDQIPPDVKAALDAKKEVYKDEIFDKLADKAKTYGADAVIAASYVYVPPYASFSSK